MTDSKSETAEPTAEQCEALLRELGLSYSQASIGIGSGRFHVYIWDKRKRPALVKWLGWPVEYHIGGGMPVAYAGGAA